MRPSLTSLLWCPVLTALTGLPALAQCGIAKLSPEDGTEQDHFGVTVSAWGEWMVTGAFLADVGGINDEAGAAYVFHREGGEWIEHSKLTNGKGVQSNHMGTAVAIADGWIAVAEQWGDDVALNGGSVLMYEWDGIAWVERPHLAIADGAGEEQFGFDLAMSSGWLAVAAPGDPNGGEESGSVYLFEQVAGAWVARQELTTSEIHDEFGTAVALEGPRLAVGARDDDTIGSESGAVHIFELENGTWIHKATILPETSATGGLFGTGVALAGNDLLVGAPAEGINHFGAAYIYRIQSDGTWLFEHRLQAASTDSNDYFGTTVTLEEGLALIGAPDKSFGNGAAYLFEVTSQVWEEKARLFPWALAEHARFGGGLALYEGLCFVGAPEDGPHGSRSGSLFVYHANGGEVVRYCEATPNSTGASTYIYLDGSLSITANNARLRAVDAPANQFSIFWYGAEAIQKPFGNGSLCVGSGDPGAFSFLPPVRTSKVGVGSREIRFDQPPASDGPGKISPGSTWYFQFWYRDPMGGGSGFNLSDGLAATFCR